MPGHRHRFGRGRSRSLGHIETGQDEPANPFLRIFNYGHMGDDDEKTCGGSRKPAKQVPLKPDKNNKDVLQVEKVDFLVATNTANHHTNEYDITKDSTNPQLVVRRGQEFSIQVDFNRTYTKEDDLRLIFQIGDDPKESKGTKVKVLLSEKDEAGKWGAKIAQKSGKSLTIAIFTPPKCIVGKWKFMVDVVKRKDKEASVFRYNDKRRIYMLFNPWNKGDAVYMENELEKDAYVLSDSGKIYSGNCNKISFKPWFFGQFEGNVLDCCMYILDISDLKMENRGDPVKVSRKLSAMINSLDNKGVLAGNWSGNYIDGKSPLSWTGSVDILEQFFSQKCPVKFGQCWVFSGVFTTVCRSLGLPARSITNFASAHDCDTSITIDIHYDSEGNCMEHLNDDSIWNFHVWNEIFMARPDLPKGYGGWQVCDATPQEASDGVYRCGPCPVRAIKEGEVNLAHDGPFIFAEVNADRVYWVEEEDGTYEPVYMDKNAVGKFISTVSALGEREDVTHLYKHPEGSDEERAAVRRANAVGSSRQDVYPEGPQDVEFELKFDSENTFVGDDFEVQLCCKNISKEDRHISGQETTSTMYYTGVVADQVAKQKLGITVKPGKTETVSMKVTPDMYQDKLKDCCMLSLSAMARVMETKQIFTKKDDARLRKPHLQIKAPATAKVGKKIKMEVSFVNPMPMTLTNCYLQVAGPGQKSDATYPQSDLGGKSAFHATLELTAAKKGTKQFTVLFNSRQLEDINGYHIIDIQD